MKPSTTVITRKARSTGTVVSLSAPGIEAVESEGWMTICVDHGGCVGHTTRKLAEGWLSHPEDWCPTCQEFKRLDSLTGEELKAAVKEKLVEATEAVKVIADFTLEVTMGLGAHSLADELERRRREDARLGGVCSYTREDGSNLWDPPFITT